MLHHLKYLEIHVAHTCNLSCTACGHYSQHHVGGLVSIDEALAWSQKWNNRLEPEALGLLGGEPSLHPQLPEFITTMKSAWPNSKLILKTNGFFLHKHTGLRKALYETQTELEINCHSDLPGYLSQYRKILELVQNWHDIKVTLKNSTDDDKARPWTRKYTGFGHSLLPFDDQNPQKSWSICHAKDCLTLFESRLWKCPPIAYLRLIAKNYQLSRAWDNYLSYSGLSNSCSDEELRRFLLKKEEPICGMCPAEEEQIRKGDPTRKAPSLNLNSPEHFQSDI